MKVVLEVGAVKCRWNSLYRVGEVCTLILEGHCGWGDKKHIIVVLHGWKGGFLKESS